jgi:hypothetical protein
MSWHINLSYVRNIKIRAKRVVKDTLHSELQLHVAL